MSENQAVSKVNANEKIVDGVLLLRRFAHRHKNNETQFGLLEAASFRDARNHLGPDFYIRQMWLPLDHIELPVSQERGWYALLDLYIKELAPNTDIADDIEE